MRNAFVKTLELEAKKNKDLVVLTGDLGYTVFEDFISKFPKQFINMGVGEANMMGVAAGLASEGKTVIVYSIIPFVTMRCYEQIRNDVCIHNANVKIIGVGSGLGYAHLGTSHHAGEDISIMRTLPGMVVLVPSDSFEVTATLKFALKFKGPAYIRLGKVGEPLVHKNTVRIDKNVGGHILRSGKDILIFATGTITSNVILAASILEKKGLNPQVVSIPIVKPLSPKWIIKQIEFFSYIFTVEEHSIVGGFGSAIAEVLLEHSRNDKYFKRIGFNDQYCRVIGSYDYMRDQMGLSPAKIAQTINKSYFEKIIA